MTEEDVAQELVGTWDLLERPTTSLLRSAKTNIIVAGRPVQAAIDAAGARHVLIPHSPGPDATLWRSRSMHLSRTTLAAEKGGSATWLALKCRRHEVEDVFCRMTAQLLARLRTEAEESLASLAVDLLDSWRDLFGGGSGGISLTGILGELLVLNDLATLDPIAALEAWEGPRGGRHDFRRGRWALEVKSSISLQSNFVRIHGLHQLDVPTGGSLFVRAFRFERLATGSVTIETLVKQIERAGIPRMRITEVLADLGIQGDDKEAFELRDSMLFMVGDAFPRLIPASFVGGQCPFGVSQIEYSCELPIESQLEPGETTNLYSKLIGR